MSAPFVIPFNFDPSSTATKMAAYTVPAGKYAQVKTSSSFLSFNGSNVYPLLTTVHTYTASVGSASGVPTSTTNTQSYGSSLGIYISSATFTTSSSNWANTSASGILSTGFATIGETIASASRSSSGSTAIASNYCKTNVLFSQITLAGTNLIATTPTGTLTINAYFGHGSSEFWVPSGTVIDGNQYVVTEYSKIS